MTHYSSAFRFKDMKKDAINAAYHIHKSIQDNDTTPVICFSGFSGSTFYAAIAMELLNLGYDENRIIVMYVRKPNEESHGTAVENNLYFSIHHKKFKLFFADDFIISANTLKYTVNKTLNVVLEYINTYKETVHDLTLIAVIDAVLQSSNSVRNKISFNLIDIISDENKPLLEKILNDQ